MITPPRFVACAALLLAYPLVTYSAEDRAVPPLAATAANPPAPKENEELIRLYAEDQTDRKPPPGKSIDWTIVGPRDNARLARVKELYATNQLKTGVDYYHAAMILQHGEVPEDYLLAHELCVVAISKGYNRALWLAAASEDRFLRALGRPQRFGTQYLTEGDAPTRLQETDPSVTDDHRRAMKAPPLAEAKSRASRFDGGKTFNLAPIANAPALTQDLFGPDDDATSALEKVRKFVPQNSGDFLVLQRACRDICLRFSAPPIRAGAMLAAASHWQRLSPEHIAQLSGWDPAEGEHDPEFTPDQRAAIGLRLSYGRAASKAKLGGVSYEDALLDEMAGVAANHLAVRQARESLINAALSVAPEKAISKLRALYPEDRDVAAAIRQLEAIGQPCEFELTTLEGRTIRPRDFRGKVIVLHFFAQRFAFSTAAVPQLKELLTRHGANLAVVGINTDKDRAAAEQAIAQHAISWPVHHDRAVGSDSVATRFHAQILPYFLLLDRAGNLRFRGIHPTEPATLRRIEALLAER